METGFAKHPSARVLINDTGFYKELELYTRAGKNYVKLSRGYVRLGDKINAGDLYGSTSHPKVRWLEITFTQQF